MQWNYVLSLHIYCVLYNHVPLKTSGSEYCAGWPGLFTLEVHYTFLWDQYSLQVIQCQSQHDLWSCSLTWQSPEADFGTVLRSNLGQNHLSLSWSVCHWEHWQTCTGREEPGLWVVWQPSEGPQPLSSFLRWSLLLCYSQLAALWSHAVKIPLVGGWRHHCKEWLRNDRDHYLYNV